MDIDDKSRNERHDNRAHKNKEPTEDLIRERNLYYAPNFQPSDRSILFDERAKSFQESFELIHFKTHEKKFGDKNS